MIAENLKNIRENLSRECFRIGRDPQSVELIAVSKTFPAERIVEAMHLGIMDFGENYVQEMVEKRTILHDKAIRWHFIGHLQSNKVKYIAEWVHLIHSVDSIVLASEIQKRAAKLQKQIEILIEVNTSGEPTKFGVSPASARDIIKKVDEFPNINLKGLMTIGPFSENKEKSRAAFSTLRTIFDEVNAEKYRQSPMTVLSMGMTHDYSVALEEGSTMVRIGTAIFGSRKNDS